MILRDCIKRSCMILIFYLKKMCIRVNECRNHQESVKKATWMYLDVVTTRHNLMSWCPSRGLRCLWPDASEVFRLEDIGRYGGPRFWNVSIPPKM